MSNRLIAIGDIHGEIEKLNLSESKQSTELSAEERLVNLENAMQDLILTTLGGE